MRRRALVAMALPVVLLAGCGPLGAGGELRGDLRAAGYDVDRVGVETTGGRSQVDVVWRSQARTAEALGRERDDVARRVWRSAVTGSTRGSTARTCG